MVRVRASGPVAPVGQAQTVNSGGSLVFDRQKARIFAVNFKNLFCVGNLTHRPRALMYRREDSWRVELLLGQVDRVLFAGYWEVNHQRLLGNTHCKL